jgi:hypothetical protein
MMLISSQSFGMALVSVTILMMTVAAVPVVGTVLVIKTMSLMFCLMNIITIKVIMQEFPTLSQKNAFFNLFLHVGLSFGLVKNIPINSKHFRGNLKNSSEKINASIFKNNRNTFG